ncbi:GntR family transcriptional regulator [Streptomyces avermitilis]
MNTAGGVAPPSPGLALRPPYQRTAADLRRQILSGQLRPGERLPSVRSLQEQYAIAGGTAQAALRVLRAEGLVDIVHGRGSFVTDPLPQEVKAMSGESADARRAEALKDTLRDVLSHMRPQGHPNWELNTCLVTNAQLTRWWAALVTPGGRLPTSKRAEQHGAPGTLTEGSTMSSPAELRARAADLESRVPPVAAGPRTDDERMLLEKAAALRTEADRLEIPGASGTLQERVTEVIENEVPTAYAELATTRLLDAIGAWRRDVREQGRQAAVSMVPAVCSGQVPESVAREIADAVLDCILPDDTAVRPRS